MKRRRIRRWRKTGNMLEGRKEEKRREEKRRG
jgi:hypothetical protein